MRVLYLSQYFPPEVGATQTRAFEMARHLVSAGHEVTMLTEVPNHPSGIIPPQYRGKLFERSEFEGIDVVRIWVKASPVKTFRNRMMFYISYMMGAVLFGLLGARGRYDVIYATSPPLFVGGAAVILSYLRRTPLIFEVRDLWPESAVAMGEVTNFRAVALAGKLEELCYNRARSVVVVTGGIRQRLEERGFGSKLTLIPNGANTDLFKPDPVGAAAFRAEMGLRSEFLVLYAGIHGLAQGLETVLEAAWELSGVPDVHFVFIGEGPKKAELVALKNKLELENVTMLPERSRSEMPACLTAADVALVPLRRLDLFRGALPSKMFDAWACACPVILGIDGEAREVMEEAKAGVFVEPEDAGQLAAVIRQLKQDPEQLQRYGRHGRLFVVAHFSRQCLAARLEALLLEIVEGTPG